MSASSYSPNGAYGGGVYVDGGTLLMNGGKITGNNVSSSYLYNDRGAQGGGVIYGNNAKGGLENSAADGRALYCVVAGTAQYGTVDDNTFYRSGDFDTSVNSTIRITDGNLLLE